MCNFTARDSTGRTALSYIAEAGDYEMFQILLEMASASDCKILLNDAGDSAGRSPIWWAAGGLRSGVYDRGAEMVEALCQEPDAAIQLDSIGPGDENAIAVAARKGRYRMVQAMIAARPDLADVPDDHGRTPLSMSEEATDSGIAAKIAEVLLQTGRVNVDSRSSTGRTPLEYAVAGGKMELVRVLVVQGGADLKNAFTWDAEGNLHPKKGYPEWDEQRILTALRALAKEQDIDLDSPGQTDQHPHSG